MPVLPPAQASAVSPSQSPDSQADVLTISLRHGRKAARVRATEQRLLLEWMMKKWGEGVEGMPGM